ncbi:MAG: hypothetical protein WC642_00665, partial [Nocardioides sp.]
MSTTEIIVLVVAIIAVLAVLAVVVTMMNKKKAEHRRHEAEQLRIQAGAHRGTIDETARQAQEAEAAAQLKIGRA